MATLRADMDRDKVFTAREAVAYGLADEVHQPSAIWARGAGAVNARSGELGASSPVLRA